MTRSLKLSGAWIIAIAACLFSVAADESPSPAALVDVLRQINTAERSHAPIYVPMEQLSQDLQPKARAQNVRLLISGDQHSYSVFIQDRNDKRHAFYADDRGLIWQAEPIH